MAEHQRPPIDCLIGQDDFVAVSRYAPGEPASEVLLAIRDRTVTGAGVAAVVLDLDRLDQLLLHLFAERLHLARTRALSSGPYLDKRCETCQNEDVATKLHRNSRDAETGANEMSEQMIQTQMASNDRRIMELESWIEQAYKDGREAQYRDYLSEQNELLQANERLANQLAEVL